MVISQDVVRNFMLSCVCGDKDNDCLRELVRNILLQFPLMQDEIDHIIVKRTLPESLGGGEIHIPSEEECIAYIKQRADELRTHVIHDIQRRYKSGIPEDVLWDGVKKYLSREEFEAAIQQVGGDAK